MPHRVELLMSGFVTHDTRRLVLSKPDGFEFVPGQGVELSIDAPGHTDEGHPFTPTCLPGERALELTVKRYPERDGLTVALHGLAPGAPLLLSDPFGTITYQGPGVFIAAGTGITPFLAILRQLAAEDALEGNGLLFSNKTEADLICGRELRHYLGERCVFTFTQERVVGAENRRIDARFLSEHIDDPSGRFYVCGPGDFVASVTGDLRDLGAAPDRIVVER